MPGAKPNKKDKLTLKERKLISGIAKGLSISEAARQAGYAEKTIDKGLRRITGKNRVREVIEEIMKNIGITNDVLLTHLKEGLEATKIIAPKIINATCVGIKNTNLKTKNFVEVPDHDIRLKYLKIALFLKGHNVVK